MPRFLATINAPAGARRLALAGFMATAIAFGPARMGFGLFLPTFRQAFDLSTAQAGWIASGGFLAFLIALPLTAWLGNRIGPRVPVVAGVLAAVAGFALVGVSADAVLLAVGVALAGTSAGFCWVPFNDATERIVLPSRHTVTLSAVATGTTLGVAAAGGLALAVSSGVLSWRAAWGVFSVAGVVATLAAVIGLPRGRATPDAAAASASVLLHPSRLPLYAASLVYGATNAVYLSFAADHVVAAGGGAGFADHAASPVIFVSYGLVGLLGLATAWIEARIGLSALVAVIFAAFACSLVLVGLVPGSLTGVIISAGLHGAAVMVISAVLSFWTLRLFPGRGSTGFTAALIAAAAGSVVGPAVAAALIDAIGPQPAFLILALPSVGVVLAFGVRARRLPS
ncbi:MFS transporter [Roseospira marina]|uniref:MFS transporter n=1 Tax=Roseospira marina TaxID=140057 RepID=A0A5M6ICS0_9PROT|nr:MFS transporter [Roseospira marina]KAA5606003.1 MFS transporter [Roseospira marina]MBB4313144.1 putative MFS family arabinose efflux permease [Roseospira marina]MBB5086115.1 putative MFS family arabinose efflux permease [Roseospira marina]